MVANLNPCSVRTVLLHVSYKYDPNPKFGITERVFCLNIQTQIVHIQSDRYVRPADECRHNGVYIYREWPGNIHTPCWLDKIKASNPLIQIIHSRL